MKTITNILRKFARPSVTPPKRSTIVLARAVALVACCSCFFTPIFGFLLMLVAFSALDLGCTQDNF